MKKNLYMHMGYPKTGSTTIQHFLYTNRQALLREGVCYPSSHIIDESVFNYKYENQIFALQCYHNAGNKFQHLKDWTYYRDQIIEEIVVANCEKNIVSAEMFIYEHSDNIKYWLKYFNITAIYYLRNFFDWLVSMQKEYIKYSLAPNLFTIDLERNFLIFACARYQIKVLKQENCLFLDFDKIKREEGLLNNFMQQCEIDKSNNLSITSNENVSPTDAFHIFLYQMALAPFTLEEFNEIKKSLISIDLSKYTEFHSNTLPPNIYNLDEYAKESLKEQGKLLHDSDWYDKNLARADELSKIPYQDLPSEIQYYIFERLSDKARELICSWRPAARNATPTTEFLPSMNNFYESRDMILPLYTKYAYMMRQ